MVSLSESERRYIEGGVEVNIRNDGRGRHDYRDFTIETGSIATQANGSCLLKLHTTDILVAVKVELGIPDEDAPDCGKLQFAVECSPSAAREFEGRGAEELNGELAGLLQRIFDNKSALDLKKLCIIPGQRCWILYVDALVLDSGGNLIDAISIASKAALFNTKIPKINLVPGEHEQMEIEIDDESNEWTRIDTENIPICVTLTKIGSRHIVDATLEEELCINARLTIAINKKGNVCSIQKGGSGGLDPSLLHDMMLSAKKIGLSIIEKLDHVLKEEERQKKIKVCFM